MGSFSSKTTTVNKPSEQQLQAGDVLNSAFQSQMPKIQAYADQIGGLIPSMMAKYQAGNTGVNAAQNWVSNTLQNGGTNPYLQQMIDMTGNDTARAINANMGTRGLMGGSVQQKILAEQLAKQSLGLRYNDWNSAQQRQMQAAGLAPSLAAADTIQIAPLLSAASYASGTPLNAASQYASGMGGLFGNTGSQTTTQSQPWGQVLLNAAASAAQSAAMASDVRLKEDIRKVGMTDAGLPIYTFRYKGEPRTYMGVMAQDVAHSQPHALGPLLDGEYMTVNYGEVR